MASASPEQLAEIHAGLADEMAKILKEGIKALDKEGTLVTLTPSAAYLAAIAKFLKDNGVDAHLGKAGRASAASSFETIKTKALPFLRRETEDDEDAHIEH
jgi:hypothetical protein